MCCRQGAEGPGRRWRAKVGEVMRKGELVRPFWVSAARLELGRWPGSSQSLYECAGMRLSAQACLLCLWQRRHAHPADVPMGGRQASREASRARVPARAGRRLYILIDACREPAQDHNNVSAARRRGGWREAGQWVVSGAAAAAAAHKRPLLAAGAHCTTMRVVNTRRGQNPWPPPNCHPPAARPPRVALPQLLLLLPAPTM